jgi:hypothetical protein
MGSHLIQSFANVSKANVHFIIMEFQSHFPELLYVLSQTMKTVALKNYTGKFSPW